MVGKKTFTKIRKIVAYVVLTAGALFFSIPFLWMLSTSLKSNRDLFAWPPIWLPYPPLWKNYVDAVTNIPFFRFAMNTLLMASLGVLGAVVSCSLVAYGLARIRWPGRNVLFAVTILVMLIPYEITMIPLFLLFQKFGWIDTLLPLWVPSWLGVPFYIFLLRQFFMSIPMELSDSARMDGASHWRIYSSIILPLSKSALGVVALFQFVSQWTDFMRPLIYLHSEEKYTLSLGLVMFQTQHRAMWQQLMAASIITIIPIIIIFLFLQRTFIEGIHLTGIKA